MNARALVYVLLFFAVVTLLAVTVNRAATPPDALTAYHAIQPGADRSILRGFNCYDMMMFYYENVCSRQDDSTAHSVFVTLSGDEIRHVSISLRGLHLDTLASRYGHGLRRADRARYEWHYCYGDGVLVTVYGRPFGTLASTHISFSPSRQSC